MTELILYKQEQNPDVFFTKPSQWIIGNGWTIDDAGATFTNGGGAGNLQIDFDGLKPYTEYRYKFAVNTATVPGGQYARFYIGISIVESIVTTGALTIYEGTFTTDDNVGVEFAASNGADVNITYLNIVEYPDDYKIDLTDEIDVPINLSIADIQDPAKRDASFSRTVTIPGTKENNRFFNHIFEISSEGAYNPNKKAKAVIVNDGIQQFVGFCKLDNINRLANGFNNYSAVSYEVTLMGDLGQLFYELGDTMLSELDFSEYNHVLNRANIISSWYDGITRNGAPYDNFVEGGFLVVSSCVNTGGRVQMNFSSAHGMSAGDWILFPEGSINLTGGSPELFYLGEHMVYSVPGANSVVLQCPFYAPAGSITTVGAGVNRVRPHYKTGEGYVYPYIDFDQNQGYTWFVNQLYPAIYVKTIWDKIFKKAKFTYDSDLINSVMFKKMIIPYTGGKLKLDNTTITNRLFSAKNTNNQFSTFNLTNGGVVYSYIGGAITPINVQVDDDTTAPMFDNSGVFNTGTYRYTPNETGIYTLSIGAIVKWYFTNPGGVTFTQYIQGGYIQLEVYDYTNNVVLNNAWVQHQPTPLPDQSTQDGTPWIEAEIDNLYLSSSNSYGLRITVVPPVCQFTGAGATVTMNYGVYGGTCFFNNKVKNTNVNNGDTVYMNSILPKMKCTEWLSNIIKMFNLYLDLDKTNDRKFYIQTRDEFYSAGAELDWTDKLDISQRIQIEPMAGLQAKLLKIGYSSDGDFYNKDHEEKYGITYGNKDYQIDTDFKADTYETKVSFASTPLVPTTTGMPFSNIQGSTDTDNQNDPMTGKMRILYFNTAAYGTQILSYQGDPVTGNYTPKTVHGYAGHLDKIESPYHDLNFDYPRGVYFDYDSWTDRNLFNLYYRRMIQEVTDKDSKYVTAYLKLSAADIFTLDFRNTFVIDGHHLRLNKIVDFIVGKNIPVKCEFIKISEQLPGWNCFYCGGDEDEVGWGEGVGFSLADQQSFEFGLGQYSGEGNSSSQGGDVNKVINQGSNKVGRYSFNVIVNGENNDIGKSTSNVLVTGYNNVIGNNVENVSLINCTGLTLDLDDNGKTFIANGLVIPNLYTTAVYSALSPEYVDGDYSDYLHDGSSGDITYLFVPSKLEGCSVNIKVIEASGNIIITSTDPNTTFDGYALPYTIPAILNESWTILSDGTNLKIR